MAVPLMNFGTPLFDPVQESGLQFSVISYGDRRRRYDTLEGEDACFLVRDNWDDYGFKTSCSLVYFTSEGERLDVGEVKVMTAGLRSGYPDLPESFESLDPTYASLGQDQSYYENMLTIPELQRLAILAGLRDVLWDSGIRQRFATERAYEDSLTRSVGEMKLQKQIEVIHERARNTRFEFSYSFPGHVGEVEFVVDPESRPPSNIHVVIGRNGVGKTRLLASLSSLLLNGRDRRRGRLTFANVDDDADISDQFANLVTVAFSAFDAFEPPARRESSRARDRTTGTRSGLSHDYVGMKKWVRRRGERLTANKSDADLLDDFLESTLQCLRSSRRPRWHEAMGILESDPVFSDLRLRELAELPVDEQETAIRAVFGPASSGHKIVLLTISRLVELVSERTLVLVDEPEAHLHPPLVMALIRALSGLLAHRNGVAILATHSPVVVQEVPRSCVTLMFRTGDDVSVERPQMHVGAVRHYGLPLLLDRSR